MNRSDENAMGMVGRGDSDWLANPGDYTFTQYQRDAAALVARVTAPAPLGWFARLFPDAGYDSADFEINWVGTSMGGLIGMLFAAQPKSPIRSLVLNDVGPRARVIEISGVGHAPALMDIEQVEPIRQFLLERDRTLRAPFELTASPGTSHSSMMRVGPKLSSKP